MSDQLHKIDSFRGHFNFLSNFFPVIIPYEGLRYKSVEHAYQAAKSKSFTVRIQFTNPMTPGEAKRKGRRIALREDWEEVKLPVMRDLLRIKFSHPDLRGLLLKTGESELIEGNHWDSFYWGVCCGVGENHLGKLLMQVRTECREAQLLLTGTVRS